MDDLTRLLGELVAIPSINPFGGEGPAETELANFLLTFLRHQKIDCELQPVLPPRSNVIAKIEGGQRRLLLEAHMDTVKVDGMEIAPFEPKVEGNRLYGRGACDTKASLAAMLLAVRDAAAAKDFTSTIVVAATADEEFTFKGALALCDWLRADGLPGGAVVGEPTDLALVIAHKGVVRWRLRTRGVSAHSSAPQKGVNAIYRMAKLLGHVEQYANGLLRSAPQPLLGTPTMNVGTIRGGQTVNTVPDLCTVEIERRTLPGEDPGAVYRAANEYLREAAGVEFEAEEPFLVDHSLQTPSDAHIVRLLREVLTRLGVDAKLEGAPYGTDASKFARIGVPSLVFGPGSVAQCHTACEFVDLAQVRLAYRAYRELIRNF